MISHAVGFWSHKQGGQPREWEDCFAYSQGAGRAAVADGASASVQAAQWAQNLVRGFIADPFDPLDEAAFAGWIKRRDDEFAEINPPVEAGGSWYQEAAMDQAAFATFLGVEFRSDGRYSVVGVGDSCLFHVRDGALTTATPIVDSEAFGTTPDLMSSDPEQVPQILQQAFRGSSSGRAGDTFLLATDAVSQWALARGRTEPEVWQLLELIDSDSFARLAEDARSSDDMENDDVTLLRVQLG